MNAIVPKHKSLAVAILLNFVIPGGGYIYMGRWVLGIATLFVVVAMLLIFPLGIIGYWIWMAIDMLILSNKRQNQIISATTKKCPYCAELIQREALVCRYCHHDLVGQSSPPPTNPVASIGQVMPNAPSHATNPTVASSASVTKTSSGLWLLLILGGIVLLGLGYNYFRTGGGYEQYKTRMAAERAVLEGETTSDLREDASQATTNRAITTSSDNDWKFTENQDGVVMTSTSQNATIYLGTSCDAISPQYGKGKWEWANAGWSVTVGDKIFRFPRADPPIEPPSNDLGRCEMR
jgi:hypothetical protein